MNGEVSSYHRAMSEDFSNLEEQNCFADSLCNQKSQGPGFVPNTDAFPPLQNSFL